MKAQWRQVLEVNYAPLLSCLLYKVVQGLNLRSQRNKYIFPAAFDLNIDFQESGFFWLKMEHQVRAAAFRIAFGFFSHRMTLQLSGVKAENISDVVSEPIQGRKAKVYLGFLDENFALVTDPIVIFDGRMDTVEIIDGGPTATITLLVENRLRDLERARTRRYTDADQQARFPNDKGLEYVPSLQEIDIPWGRVKD